MDHLHESRLEEIVLVGDAPDAAEAAHLADCPLCAQQVAGLETLKRELKIARLSAPAPAQMERYNALFAQVPRRSAGERLAGWLDRVRLVLALDSRQSAPALGLRRAAGFGHRLLYSSDLADVELLLEPEGELWQIDGDILPIAPDSDTGSVAPPYLIEGFAPPDAGAAEAAPRFQTESDANGRFRLADVSPGQYTLVVTPTSGPLIEIVGLVIP